MTAPPPNNMLTFEPKTRFEAFKYVQGVSGYSLKDAFAKQTVTIAPEQIVRCTRVTGRIGFCVVEFKTERLNHIMCRDLPHNFNIPMAEKSLFQFYKDWLLDNWQDTFKTLVVGYYCLSLLVFLIPLLWLVEAWSVPRDLYRTPLITILILYSLVFPIVYYRLTMKSLKTAWNLRSLQVQTILLFGIAIFLGIRAAVRYFL